MSIRNLMSAGLSLSAVLHLCAAETVAKFAALEAGAKSGAFKVSENGRTITSEASWLAADGTTVVVDYAGLSLSGTQAIVTLAQSNDSSNLSMVGICSSDGVLKGVWQGSAWTGGENTGYELAESGCLVFVYYPDASTRGVFVYDSKGTEVFRAKGLKSTGSTVTTGGRFDIGATASNELSQDGFTVNSVRIYRGSVEAADVPLIVASSSEDLTLPNGTYTVSHVLSGSGALTVDAGANGVITLGAANTFTGGLTVKSGTLKTTNATGYGPNNWNDTANLATIAVETGATLDLGNTKDSCYAITSAGTLTNSGSAIGPTNRQTTRLTLADDTTVSGNQFGLLGPGYAATTLALGEHTLTVDMATAETTFILCTTTVTGAGKIRLEQGKLYLKKAITGTLNLDLPATPEDGATLFVLDNERDLSKLNLHVTIDGEELPANITVSKEGVVSVAPDSSPIVRDESARTWTLDTTEAAYTLAASEIRELKANAITFTVSSASENGATIDLGTNTTSQNSHYIFASGSHTLKWAAGSLSNGTLDFDTTGTDENPSILVRSGATLNFYAKDVTGWIHDAKTAKTSVIKVESGATLKLYKNGNNTWFFQGRFIIEPGATIEAVDFEADKFRLNGGVYGDWQELVVPAATETDNAVVFKSNVGFRLAKDETTGYGINVGEGSTLTLEGNLTSDGARNLGKFGAGTLVITGSLSGFSGEIKLHRGAVRVKATSGLEAAKVVQFEADGERAIVATTDGEWIVYTNAPMVVFDPEKDELASGPVLRFSEIMPKPSDKTNESTTQAGYDRNGLESGWVELENTSDKWVDLGDYKFCRANRGKVYTHADYGNFPSGTYIPPHGRFTFYTSERYSNSYPEAKDGNTSAFQHGTFDGKPIWYGDMLIWGDKVNPKKFPYVTLVYKPEGAADQILETVIIPSDTPEGYSIIVGHDEGDGEATKRWLCPTPTFNKANSDTTDLVKIGPNVGPAYGTKHSATEFGPTAPAKPGVPYAVRLNVNPIYHASGMRAADAITAVTLVYRRDLDDTTRGRVTMTKTGVDAGGDVWTAEIPAEAIPAAGHLLQWKTEITDAANNTWTSPSFMNKDDGYEWFGTITEPGELDSAKLPTWHLFADALSLKWMDTDADDQSPTEIPNQARVAIYDSSTSNYYDYVRIDLRGNTSANFAKKSHGLRFSKVHPLTMKDAVRGGRVKEIRKSSLIGEPADPSFMRQMVAFWLWDRMGNKVPFDFPVRCNLNGAFYQLAFHSERFTDELIEDVYGFDKYGYGYKNVGTLKSGSGTTAGGIEKKTPDDGNESDISVLQNDLRQPLADLGIDKIGASDNAERPAITKFVVEKFDLPAWLNYLASARITQEMDDVWANISMYKDDAEMLEGTRGTGTWMPLGYDFNLTFGQWYYNDVGSGSGLMANQDWFKSHPFYGGNVVRCYRQAAMTTTCNEGNRGIEAVWQSPKFRRLYLRRLRTLMDQELKAPGTAEADVPFMVKMRELATLMAADAVLDQKKWPHSSSNTDAIDVWRGETAWPETMAAGIDDIWNNYVVPRQTHLYVTHAVTNGTMTVGYGSPFNAGIPAAQASLDVLKEGLSAAAVEGGVVIRNANAEAIDLSGWDVSGPVVMKLPAGTVIDQAIDGTAGELFVVTDRKAYVAANKATLTDQVIVGNAKTGSGTAIRLTAADGTVVLSAVEVVPGGASVTVKAATAEAAVAQVTVRAEVPEAAAGAVTPEDYVAYFKAQATPVEGVSGAFTVTAVLNPETVPTPEIGVTDGRTAPLFVEADSDGQALVVGVVNAKPGLWYGLAASSELQETSFADDLPSFVLATSPTEKMTLRASRRTGAAAFFRVRVVIAAPIPSSHPTPTP